MKERAPNAICEMTTTGTLINLMVNRVNPPFDNPEIRKAMSLALDRKPFNTILMEGRGRLGGAMLPKPEGEWGMPADMVASLTGYGADTEMNCARRRRSWRSSATARPSRCRSRSRRATCRPIAIPR
jgi:peptide/nickel transport system substrate-binding protein